MLSEDRTLPRRQWALRRQRIHRGLQRQASKLVLLWRQRPFSKQDCRKAYPGPAGTNPDVHAVCNE